MRTEAERREYGRTLNEIKAYVEDLLKGLEARLGASEMERVLVDQSIDHLTGGADRCRFTAGCSKHVVDDEREQE